MAGSGTRATAQDYNNIQAVISSVMGIGTGTTGYGQPIASSPVSQSTTMTSTQWDQLRDDLTKARVHQTNTGVSTASTTLGSPWQTLFDVTPSTVVQEAIRLQYQDFADNGVNANRAVVAAAQTTSGVSLTSTTRGTNWGTSALGASITHTVTLTFAGYTSGSLTVPAADHIRCFFNAGGSIQITASRTGAAATTKDTDWTNMLSGFGTLNFRASSTNITGGVNAGGSVGSAVGFQTLTIGAAASNILTQSSSVTQYAENRYLVGVSRPTANTLAFTITFTDNDAGDQTGLGPPVDEPVTGTITSSCLCTRPSGANVDVPAPTGSATAL
jgi:hypothetical protein